MTKRLKLEEGMASCVGCGKPATKYCEGWDHSSQKPGKYGHFEFSVQCGYPVCDTCVHVSNDKHEISPQPKE